MTDLNNSKLSFQLRSFFLFLSMIILLGLPSFCNCMVSLIFLILLIMSHCITDGLRKVERGRGGAVVKSLACCGRKKVPVRGTTRWRNGDGDTTRPAKVPWFKSRPNLSGQPVSL